MLVVMYKYHPSAQEHRQLMLLPLLLLPTATIAAITIDAVAIYLLSLATYFY